MNWCASVVLPQPGSPTTRLNEYSGHPPPSTSSSFSTPEGKRLMETLRGSLMITFALRRYLGQHLSAPCLLHEREDHILSDERARQFAVALQQGCQPLQDIRSLGRRHV